jgi:hypothetical protein
MPAVAVDTSRLTTVAPLVNGTLNRGGPYFKFSVFDRPWEVKASEVPELTMDEVRARFQDRLIVEDKKQCPLFASAVFAPFCRRKARVGTCFTDAKKTKPCDGGQHRLLENVDWVTAFTVDIDGLPKDEFWDRFKPLEDTRGFIYTTHSATIEKVYGRIVYPYRRPVSVSEHDALWPHLNTLTGGLADPACKDASRMMFFPSSPPATVSQAWFSERPGALLNPDKYLAGLEVRARKAKPDAGGRKVEEVEVEQVFVDAARAALAAVKRPEETVELFRRVLEGESFVKQSNDPLFRKDLDFRGREPTLTQLCNLVAFYVVGLSTDDFLALIRPSLLKVQDETAANDGKLAPDGGAYPSEEMARVRYAVAVEHARERYAVEKTLGAELEEGFDVVAKEQGFHVVPDDADLDQDDDVEVDDEGKYTPAYLRRKEQELGYNPGDLGPRGKRWFISFGNAYYIWKNGRYHAPVTRASLRHTIERDLARAPVELWAVSKKGDPYKRDPLDLVDIYGSLARHHQAQLYAQTSYFEPATETFYEAVCPLRPLSPVYNQDIDGWLDALFGDDRELGKNWIAAVTLLHEQSAALALIGAKSAGKTMLAEGLARLWRRSGAVKLDAIMGNFNGSLLSCPLVVADESLPRDSSGKVRSQELRNIIGSNSRTLNQKYMFESQLDGALRLVICANNEDLFKFNESLSHDDLDAIRLRFLCINVGPQAPEYLRKLGGRVGTSDWVDGDKIAQHALWLRQERTYINPNTGRLDLKNRGDRFLVEGKKEGFAKHVTHNFWVGLVCEWITGLMSDPGKMSNLREYFVLKPGKLFINNRALIEGWSNYVHSHNVPTTDKLNNAMSHIASGTEALEVGKRKLMFHQVYMPYVYEWSERHQVGDVERIKETIERGTFE